jgi:glycosyltransferase involved in cell wall biosynthesis
VRTYFVTSSYPRHESDHAGSFVHSQVTHLAELGVRPEVFCWDDKLRATLRAAWPVHRVQYAPSDAQYLFYGSGAPENLERYPGLGFLALPAVAAMVARLLRSPRPDIVVAHWFAPAGIIARVVAAIWDVPSIVVGHSGGIQLLDKLPEPARTAAFRLVASGITTTVSEPLRQIVLQAAPNADVRNMPMGVELPSRDVVPVKSGALFLGRLEPIKGVDIAIRACRLADWNLTVAGEGSMRHAVESSNAEFLGFVSGDDKWQTIDAAQVSLHPSVPQSGRHEGLPVAMLECAARGTFPLVSGAPGVERWLEIPQKQIRRAGDPEDMAAGLRWWTDLAPATKKRLAEAQRARVEPLSWERWRHEWRALLNEAIETA